MKPPALPLLFTNYREEVFSETGLPVLNILGSRLGSWDDE
jgi:hypothetical protein